MAKSPRTVSAARHPLQQRSIATICIGIAAVLYMLGLTYVQQLMQSLSPSSPNVSLRAMKLAHAPDILPLQAAGESVPIMHNVPTSQPVVFLTIDDGVHRDPDAARLLAESHVPASLFLTQHYIAHDPRYFSQIAGQSGTIIQNHTMSHPDLHMLEYDAQKRELCDASDAYLQLYGARPTLFRPPYGNYSLHTQRAAAACGMRAVVLWTALVEYGGMQYQVGDKLRSGDIVLMHFTPQFKDDLQAFLSAAKAAGLTPQLLEDWIAPV